MVSLTDSNGEAYDYAVAGIMTEVSPTNTWSPGPPASGNDVVPLRTCMWDFGDYWTEGSNWFARYVVRAERVRVSEAGAARSGVEAPFRR